MDATERLGRFASTLQWEDLPASTVAAAKNCLLDGISCMIGGSTTSLGRKVSELVQSWSSRPDCTIVGDPQRAALPLAAYVNGFLANVCDWDDNYFMMGHPGPAIIPVALGVGEVERVSGRELLTAIVAGYEVGISVGCALMPSLERRRVVRGMSTWLIFGGVAAGARLMGFDQWEMANAFGLAAQNASVPFLQKLGYHDRPFSELKNNFGWSCAGAVMVLELARLGFHGPRNILEGETGFWRMAGSDRWEWEEAASRLGTTFEIEAVFFKAHPSCLGTHASIEALRQILEHLGVRADQVARVEVHGGESLARFRDYRPLTFTDGMFSIPYALALVLLGIEPGPRWWSDATLEDPEVIRAASKIELLQDPNAIDTVAGERHVRVVVFTTDGRVCEAEAARPLPRGHTGLTQTEIESKLRVLAEPVLGQQATADILALVQKIEEVPDVLRLTRLLASPAVGAMLDH